ncbi:4Fe-4S binding protein [Stygiolobus caldivivus]|nr:4Fe-4S binding protein [Stygiolobus caldivivus]
MANDTTTLILLLSSVLISVGEGITYIKNYKRPSLRINFLKILVLLTEGLIISTILLVLTILSNINILWIISLDFIYLFSVFLMSSKFSPIKGEEKSINNIKVALPLLFLPFATALFLSSDILIYTDQFQPSLGLYDPVWNAISYFVTITGSQWLLVIFGSFFTPLVVHKILSSRSRGNKIRLTLMLLAYWIYSTYLPNFSPVSSIFPYIPYSWFNGFGTFGPLAPSLLIGALGTYAVTAVLSFLFGSRQICSVTCTAPFMLQGTVIGDMKVFNRTAKVGKKMLTSRLSTWYKVVTAAVWVMLLAFATVSLLDQLGYTNFYILGNDPTVLYVAVYFNLLWYLQFLLIPFVGNYSCVNMGICTWGSFNQLFGRLGFFRLKVRDTQTCLNCKTVDCAKACPVGITDMRAAFIKKGELRSFKCIGTGECIESCPHDNIFIYDFRNWLKENYKKQMK